MNIEHAEGLLETVPMETLLRTAENIVPGKKISTTAEAIDALAEQAAICLHLIAALINAKERER